jgi:hypothetical protein
MWLSKLIRDRKFTLFALLKGIVLLRFLFVESCWLMLSEVCGLLQHGLISHLTLQRKMYGNSYFHVVDRINPPSLK